MYKNTLKTNDNDDNDVSYSQNIYLTYKLRQSFNLACVLTLCVKTISLKMLLSNTLHK